jgi:hypothetical protein
MKHIHEAIAEDLRSKLKEHNLSPYKFYKHVSQEVSEVTIQKLIKAKGGHAVSLRNLMHIYKKLGYDCISIDTSKFILYVKL